MRAGGVPGRVLVCLFSAAILVAACKAPGATDDRSGGDRTPTTSAVSAPPAMHYDISRPLRTLAPAALTPGLRTIPLKHPPHSLRSKVQGGQPLEEEDDEDERPGSQPPFVVDTVAQTTPGDSGAPVPGAGFEGVGQGFTGPQGTWTVNVAPPDPNGAVGPAHYFQIVNLAIAIFDKSGTPLYGPVPTNTLWTGFGGGCETNNSGDGTVSYDRAADRWVVTQFALSTTPYLECVAVSTSGDPMGSYARYSFPYNDFPDYPKVGVWPDAYYVTFNMFAGGVSFSGSKICAYDRAKMLAGQPATQQCFDAPGIGSFLAADVDSTTPPPAGSPSYLLTKGTSGTINLYKFHVDWTTPSLSTFTGPTPISVAPFTEACAGGNCIPQGTTTQLLASLGDRLMNRVSYRNFGDHESLLIAHSVSTGSTVGMRWYEVRNPGGTPTVFQQGTYAPDASYRWMGGLAMDKAGNIGMGFTVSSSTVTPGIHYTGRLASDPLGVMAQGEGVLIDGPGAQVGTSRWGDYTSVTVDPTDDCTFWFTHEYEAVTGGFNWHTRIGSFKVGPCDTGPPKIFSIGVNPASVEGGAAVTGTVLLSNVAPMGGATVTLVSSDPSLVTVPASLLIPAGQQTASFPITTVQTPNQTAVTITGTFPAGVSKTATLNLLASPTPTSLTLSPSTVSGGMASTGTVTLSGPAPAGGATIALTSANTAIATVPVTVTADEGATSVTFPVTTLAQSVNVSTTISAAYHAQTKSAILTVTRTVAVGNSTFDPVLKVQKCASIGSFCDTGGTVDGRAAIPGGNEPNTPNTINNSCFDGTAGTYHSDESIDGLKISTLDGSTLAPGKTAKIEATLWVYAGFSGDFLDLYYAADATNPVWTLIGTLQASAAGQQVLSTTFTLPAGGLQAIRANWRYFGSAIPCTSGSFDDRDDLVFATDSGGPDITPPTAVITAPAEGSSVHGVTPVLVSASDNIGVTKVELHVDGVVAGTLTAAPYTFSLDTGALMGGVHLLQAVAFDAASNMGSSPMVSVTVDNVAPTAIITAPADGTAVSGTMVVNVTAMDDVAVAHVDLKLDGVTVASGMSAPYVFMMDTAVLSSGGHQLQAMAFDAAGNVGPSAVVSISVDNTPPMAVLTAPANGALLKGTITATAQAGDNVGVTKVDFLVDGSVAGTATTAPYALSIDTTTLADGPHQLGARAYDATGNNGTSATASVTVDNHGPTAAITAPVNGAQVDGTVSVTASATDLGTGVVAVDFLLDGAVKTTATASPYSWAWDTTTAAAGSHILTVKARDGAGNETTSAPVAVTTTLWSTLDIGSTALAGSWSEVNGTHTVKGSGADIWGSADAFRFVYRNITGDVTITARASISTNTNGWAKAGVMMRDGTAAGARNVFALVPQLASNLYRLQARSTVNTTPTSVSAGNGAMPVYLRLVRAGNLFTASYSADGVTFFPLSSATIALPATLAVGLAITSHDNTKLATGSFDHVTIVQAASDFSMAATPASLTVAPGATGTSTISTAVTSGAAQSVALSASGVPSGTTVSFAPATVTSGSNSTMTVNVGAATAPGTYPLTITGTGASATHTTPVTLTVKAIVLNDFSIAASPAALTVGVGASGTSTISTAVTSGVAQSVALSATGAPTGTTVSFAPTSVSAGASSTMTVNVGATTAVGTYTLTVKGTGTSATHSTPVTLTVTASAGGVVNGGFESGGLSGWTTAGSTGTSSTAHSGSVSARVGNTTPTNGDSSVSQTFTIPAGATTLTFWYRIVCPDEVTYDWATATLKDNTTGTTTTVLAKTCTNSGKWVQLSKTVTAGHSITLKLISHDENNPGDATYTLYDDVKVQ